MTGVYLDRDFVRYFFIDAYSTMCSLILVVARFHSKHVLVHSIEAEFWLNEF